jgi:hypothetical protein
MGFPVWLHIFRHSAASKVTYRTYHYGNQADAALFRETKPASWDRLPRLGFDSRLSRRACNADQIPFESKGAARVRVRHRNLTRRRGRYSAGFCPQEGINHGKERR